MHPLAAHPSEIEMGGLTVMIPAYDEADSIADTIRSLRRQTIVPDEIIVIDDCSTDATGEVASALGVTVLRPPRNTGSKAGAQTFALDRVRTDLVMALDADTTLAPDAIEQLLPAFADSEVTAACGSVLPRHVGTVWERGRYVEYMLAFGFFKRVQDHYEIAVGSARESRPPGGRGPGPVSAGRFERRRSAASRSCGRWREGWRREGPGPGAAARGTAAAGFSGRDAAEAEPSRRRSRRRPVSRSGEAGRPAGFRYGPARGRRPAPAAGPPEGSPAPDHAGGPRHAVPPGQARAPLRGGGS
jgi:hypothetical protein